MKPKSSQKLSDTTWVAHSNKVLRDEKALQKYLKDSLESIGCIVYKFASPQKRGVPDLLIITPYSKAVFVEVKSPTGKGKLSALQELEVSKLRCWNMSVEVIGDKLRADAYIQAVCEGKV